MAAILEVLDWPVNTDCISSVTGFLLKLIGSLEFASRHSGAEHVWTLPSFTRNQVKLGHGVFKRSLTTPISVLLCCQKACVYSKVSATLSAIYHRYTQT